MADILFEHESLPFDWQERDLAAIDRLNRAMGADILRATIRGRQKEIKAAQHVGVVRLGHRTVQILPKVYRSPEVANEKERAREATRNLLYMLEVAGQLSVREHALAALFRRDLDWFEILTWFFATHLTDEWQRGAHRGYQAVEDELPALKGKWRITDQLRRPERKHIFAVAYDEFTADNALNRVFRFVVERLWHLTRDAENRRRLGDLRQWMDEVTLLPSVTAAQADPTLLTRLTQPYGPLLNLARLFLDGGALQLAAGDLTTFAFVLDMNQLFEAFIVNMIRRYRQEILPSGLRDCDLLPQSRGAAYYLARMDGRQVFHLKPDLAFRKDGAFPLLLDAKYKRLNTADIRWGVSEDDFYQMHAYAHRYDCPRMVLVYPQTAETTSPLHKCFVLEGCSNVIAAATLDLRNDLHQSSNRKQLVDSLSEMLKE